MKTALLVINFGGPQRAEEVEPFLFELFRDHDVIPLPGGPWIQDAFARRLSRKRAPQTIAQYARIGGGSPLVPMTFLQVEALEARLVEKGHALEVAVGMRYTGPTIREALAQLKSRGIERLICLALYPHFSFATTGSSYNAVAQALAELDMAGLPVSFIPAWHHDPGYLNAQADRVREALEKVPEGLTPHVLFTAHGLPVSFIERGDPYQAQIQNTVRDLVRKLDWQGPYSLAYQSRVGPARWLSPATDEELERLGHTGTQSVVVVPVSFVGDHIETLYELDIDYRGVAERAGIAHYLRAGALDVHPEFIGALATQVEQAIAARTRPCVRCLLPKDEAYHAQSRCPDCQFKKPAYLGWRHVTPAAAPENAAIAEKP
ncbi:MAG TPA: ferrochelatase [Oscillatoriaceae cyanobacterium]